MKFQMLGSGTPAPSLKRLCSGYVAEIGNDLIVFDHGAGVHHRFIEGGYRARDVTHFFATHYHYDHIADFPRLALTRWDHGSPTQRPLKVFGPKPLDHIMDAFFGPKGAFSMDIESRCTSEASLGVYRTRGGTPPRAGPAFEQLEVSPGDVIEGLGWTIKVGPARHVGQPLNALSYRIETEEGSIVYGGDSGGIHMPLVEFATGADVLITMNHFLSGHEPAKEYRMASGSHLDNAEIAKRAEVGLLVLTHLQPDLDRFGIKEAMINEMSQVFSGSIIVGEDLMEIPIRTTNLGTAD